VARGTAVWGQRTEATTGDVAQRQKVIYRHEESVRSRTDRELITRLLPYPHRPEVSFYGELPYSSSESQTNAGLFLGVTCSLNFSRASRIVPFKFLSWKLVSSTLPRHWAAGGPCHTRFPVPNDDMSVIFIFFFLAGIGLNW
jgi:hypothetical protein